MKPRAAKLLFTIDHMLLKLGAYLRILGCDAFWDTRLRTHELIKHANREGRLFLTRNTRLTDQYPAADRVLVVHSDEPVAQLHQVVADLKLDPTAGLFSRCIRCNVELEDVPDKTTIEGRVHPNVLARYDRFHRCPSCRTVFWKGTHVRNTCRKLGLPYAP